MEDFGDRGDAVDAARDLAGEGDGGLHVAAEVEVEDLAEDGELHRVFAFELLAEVGAQRS